MAAAKNNPGRTDPPGNDESSESDYDENVITPELSISRIWAAEGRSAAS